MYSFAQRADTRVVDEPFYAYYLHRTGKAHPGREETLRSQPLDVDTVFDQLNAIEAPVLFIKNMAKHMETMDTSRFHGCRQILLIRDPKQIISSFARGYPDPAMDDIGIAYQCALYDHFVENDVPVVVVDANELLKAPVSILSRLCNALNIPFDEKMLSWGAGPRPEDGVWAKYWYHSVHKSTGFKPPASSDRQLPDHCRDLYIAARPYYDALYLHALKA